MKTGNIIHTCTSVGGPYVIIHTCTSIGGTYVIIFYWPNLGTKFIKEMELLIHVHALF